MRNDEPLHHMGDVDGPTGIAFGERREEPSGLRQQPRRTCSPLWHRGDDGHRSRDAKCRRDGKVLLRRQQPQIVQRRVHKTKVDAHGKECLVRVDTVCSYAQHEVEQRASTEAHIARKMDDRRHAKK